MACVLSQGLVPVLPQNVYESSLEDSDSPLFGPELSPDDVISGHSPSSAHTQTPSPQPNFSNAVPSLISTTSAPGKLLKK